MMVGLVGDVVGMGESGQNWWKGTAWRM